MIQRLTSVLIFLFSFFNASFSQNEFLLLRQSLQTHLDNIRAIENAPGATLAVVLPNGQLISLAAGMEDADLKKPMPAGAPMLGGSTGKMFVSAIALQLVDERKLHLDDPVSKYLEKEPWFARLPNADALTVRSLLNHTSGLPRYIFQKEFLETVKKDPMRNWTPQECLAVLLGKAAVHPVGQGWGYSDSNYQLLGLVIEKVSGETFYRLASKRLLEPYYLRHTYPSTQRKLPGLVQGHVGTDNFFNLPKKTLSDGLYAMNPQFEWCGGGFVTSAEDMALFARSLYGGRILSPAMVAEQRKAVDFRTGLAATTGYGLGTFVWETELGRFFGHAGLMPGYLTHVEYSEKEGFAIALQFNSDQGLGQKHHTHAQRLAKVVSDYLAELRRADEAGIHENLRRGMECWNEGSVDCYMAVTYPATDSVLTISKSGMTYGYETIRQNYLKYFPKDKMGKLHFDQVKMIRMSDEYYYVIGRFHLTYPEPAPMLSGSFSTIMQKIDGVWMVISDHSG